MSSQGNSANLVQATRTLAVEWENTKTHWRDLKSQEFESKFLDGLPAEVAAATNAMEEIELLLKKVRHDCE